MGAEGRGGKGTAAGVLAAFVRVRSRPIASRWLDSRLLEPMMDARRPR